MIWQRNLLTLTCIIFLFPGLPLAVSTAGTYSRAETYCIPQQDNNWPVVKGAQLPSTNGIYFNTRDELFVTSVVGRSITQINPHTGNIVAQIGPDQGVESPDDLVFDSFGNLYWTAFLTGEVARLTPEGEKTTIANLGRGVNAITLSADESKLYVSRVFLADDIWEIDLTGINPPRMLAENLGGFNGMDIGPDGKLYGPLWYHGQVVSIDTTTGMVEIIEDNLTTPAAVKFNHAGELFVVDQSLGRVFRIDRVSGELMMVANVGVGADNLAFDSQDHLYVTNTHDSAIRQVMKVSHDKANEWMNCPRRCIGWNCNCSRHDSHAYPPHVRTVTRPGLTTSSAIALHDIGGRTSLFVADIYALREYAPFSGHPRSVAHSIVGGVSDLNTPFSLASYGSFLLTTSWFANAVQIWDPELHKVVDEYRDFAVPLNATGFADGLVVAELGSGCVMHQSANSSDRTPLACNFKVPVGLAQRDGKLFVSDWATGSIWQVTENHKKLESPSQVTSGLLQPEGIAVDESGKLLVVETGADRLLKIDPSTGLRTILADDLPLGNSATPNYPPTWVLNSVAIDNCGMVYVNVDGDRSVRRISSNEALDCNQIIKPWR